MAYSKNPTWVDDEVGGTPIDAAALNRLEAGVEATAIVADAAAPAARIVTAGVGLLGGGDLSADRSLAVSFGSTAGTAAQGDDTRLFDERVPTDGSVTDAKVAAGAAIAQTKIANLTTDLGVKAPKSETEIVVVHDGTAGGGVRPGGYSRVLWVSPVGAAHSRPTNMAVGDMWERDV